MPHSIIIYCFLSGIHSSPQSSIIIYCFLSGTHTYIDGTKDWKNMKKRLRFLLRRTPLKVLRGEKDEEDIMDKYYERFVPPTTTTTATEDENVTTDIGNVSDEGMERYLGGHTGSVGSISQSNGTIGEGVEGAQNDQVNNTGDQTVSHEAIEMQIFKQVQKPRDTDAPLTDDAISYVSNAPSTDDTMSIVSDVGSERSLVSQHSAAQSDTASHEGIGDVQFDQVNNTDGQTASSTSYQDIELQAMAQVQHPTNTDDEAAGNVRHEVFERYLGRDTGSIDGIAQFDSESQGEARRLNNDDIDDNTGNVSEEGMDRHRETDSINGAADNTSLGKARRLDNDDTDINTGYQTTGRISDEATELQVVRLLCGVTVVALGVP